MPSNFSTLPSSWQPLLLNAMKAESYVYTDPGYTAVLCRKSLEEWVRWMYEHDGDLQLPYDTQLSSLIHEQSFKNLIAPLFFQQINLIRKLGNESVHTNKKIRPEEALHTLKLLHGFIFWVANLYGEERIERVGFNETLLPKGDEAAKTKTDLRRIEDAYLQSQEKLLRATEELEQFKAQKAEHIHITLPPIDPNEALTRAIYIDALLREAGWDPEAKNVREYPVQNCMPQVDGRNGNGSVDYVLWGDNGLPLAVVEAKRTSRDPQVGSHQAKCYADCLEKQFGQRPVMFYTNGYDAWIWDDTDYAPRAVFGFYTKDELQTLVNRRTLRKSLSQEPINVGIADRYYQVAAIRAVGEVLEKKHRQALLVMATGTGKTRVSAAIIDLLSKANWVKRVLFLADRNALIHQAKVNLNDYLPHLPAIDLTKEKEDESSRIVFSTYQTIINMIDGERNGDTRSYGPGHFDLIIFDEIHRSVYHRYKYIFKYFDGYRLGLTATPKSETDRDTYGLFEMQQGDPTYAYELDQAVNDKYLVPPRAISVPLKFQRQGIKYAELNEEEKLAYEEQFADPITGAFPDEIESGALNRWLFNIDTVDKVIAHLMQHGIKVDSGDKLGKTIIFARSHDHAMFIESRFNIQYPAYKGEFLKVIDYRQEYKYDLLNHFKSKEKMPQIAVSVDMLDTGIDVPEITNLVFFKPVRSSAKFWQMIGRGTRLCENLFDLGEHKKAFCIFDFCENFDFFGQNPKGMEGVTGKSLSQQLFELRIRLAIVLQDQTDEQLQAYAQQLLQYVIHQTQALNRESFIVRQHLRTVEKYTDPNSWNALSDTDIALIFTDISPLVSETDSDELAKRFDAMMLYLQLFSLTGNPRQKALITQLRDLGGQLSKKLTIPAVSQRAETIREVQHKTLGEDITIMGMERIRVELRDIMWVLKGEKMQIQYADFEDSYAGEAKEYPLVYPVNDLETYKKKIKQYLLEHENHITIHKLKHNDPITAGELAELERMLFEQGELGTHEDFKNAFGAQPLGRFIRSITGLDVNAAKTAFSDFLSEQTLNSQQIRFIDTIINSFSANGVVEPAMLFEPPFTDIDSKGIIGLFDEVGSAKIIGVVERVNSGALVA